MKSFEWPFGDGTESAAGSFAIAFAAELAPEEPESIAGAGDAPYNRATDTATEGAPATAASAAASRALASTRRRAVAADAANAAAVAPGLAAVTNSGSDAVARSVPPAGPAATNVNNGAGGPPNALATLAAPAPRKGSTDDPSAAGARADGCVPSAAPQAVAPRSAALPPVAAGPGGLAKRTTQATGDEAPSMAPASAIAAEPTVVEPAATAATATGDATGANAVTILPRDRASVPGKDGAGLRAVGQPPGATVAAVAPHGAASADTVSGPRPVAPQPIAAADAARGPARNPRALELPLRFGAPPAPMPHEGPGGMALASPPADPRPAAPLVAVTAPLREPAAALPNPTEGMRSATIRVDLSAGETVRARVQQQADRIDVRIVTETAPTAAGISQELTRLRHALAATGLVLNDVGVGYRGERRERPTAYDERSTPALAADAEQPELFSVPENAQ
ncbi:MAG TPA: flagellar hook-length control protein FliK [Candidatus Binataceae bacterium]|nr:flagellar hook-length control protein FliK [Candidatus Binataceae bacterium]